MGLIISFVLMGLIWVSCYLTGKKEMELEEKRKEDEELEKSIEKEKEYVLKMAELQFNTETNIIKEKYDLANAKIYSFSKPTYKLHEESINGEPFVYGFYFEDKNEEICDVLDKKISETEIESFFFLSFTNNKCIIDSIKRIVKIDYLNGGKEINIDDIRRIDINGGNVDIVINDINNPIYTFEFSDAGGTFYLLKDFKETIKILKEGRQEDESFDLDERIKEWQDYEDNQHKNKTKYSGKEVLISHLTSLVFTVLFVSAIVSFIFVGILKETGHWISGVGYSIIFSLSLSFVSFITVALMDAFPPDENSKLYKDIEKVINEEE